MLPAGYMIMADGRIKGPSGRWLKGCLHPHGYRWFSVQTNGKVRKFYFHVVICEAFHGPKPSPELQVRHRDGNPSNNAAWNLCWGTVAENAADRVLHGTSRPGEQQWLAKLTWEAVRDIRARYATGTARMPQLAAEYGVQRETVNAVILGLTWKDPEYTPPHRIDLEAARRIRTRYAAGGVLQRELAAEYGVTQAAISFILLGKAWAEPETRT
jgi:hypothetical protein